MPKTHEGDTTETAEQTAEKQETPETDWKQHAKTWEKRAEDNLKELTAVRDQLAKLKTQDEQVAETLNQATARITEVELERDRARIAAKFDVPENLLTGTTEKELTAQAESLIAFKNEKHGPTVPTEGQQMASPKDDPWAATARKLFG